MNYFAELQSTIQRIDMIRLHALLTFVRACDGTLWLAGNGGSASTAQHWACDLSKVAGRRVQALGSNPAVLTAWANDESYGAALAEELRRLARDGDALICLSCSGMSENVTWSLKMAGRLGIPCALVTGMQGIGTDNVELEVAVRHTHYGIIEDCHLAIGHWLTEELRG